MRHKVRISSGVVRWPPMCACCMAPADGTDETAIPGQSHRTAAQSASGPRWQVPYCQDCLAHLRQSQSAGPPPWWVNTLVALVFGAIIFISWRHANWIIFGLMTITLALAALAVQSLWYRQQEMAEDAAVRMCGPECSGPGPAVHYLGTSGPVHTFEFANGDYAEAFVEANPKRRSSAYSR